MTGYISNIEQLTSGNTYFRKVLYTGKHAQLVLMCLQAHEEIGIEVHNDVDQFFRVESGEGKVVMNGEEFVFKDGYAFIVPAGTTHNVINTGDGLLKLYTIYSPANHPDGTIHKTKAEAEAYEKAGH